jgi:hypothetical protein
MEFLLLWADDLDDAVGAARHMLPRGLGMLASIGLFALTGFALVAATRPTLLAIALALSVALIEVLRRRVTHASRLPSA